MKRLRIGYISSPLVPGGAQRQMLALAERLPRDRFEAEFVMLSGSGVYGERAKAAGLRIRTIGGTPVSEYRLPAKLIHRAAKVIRYAAVVRAARYDIVDAWLYPADVLAALMRPITGRPVVITGRRNIDPQRFFGPLERGVNFLARTMTDVVVANSAAAASNAIRVGGVSPEKVRIIRNGVVVHPAAPATERLARRRALGVVDPDEIIVGCVGNYLPVKRHDLLIDAFAALAEPEHGLKLVLVGEGPLRPALERQIRGYGLETRVLLYGAAQDPEPLYSGFDVVVQASSREGLPNAMLEAAAAGRAIVATHAGGTAEIVLDGRTGLLVPVDDRDALAAALNRLVSDAALRERLGDAARGHVEATFGMDRFVAEFAALYEERAASRVARSSRTRRR